MNILLDENIPVQLRAGLPGHAVKSVNDRDLGWKNLKNGRLLAEMEGRFDVLITADRNMFAQQNLAGRRISILVLPSNRRNEVLALQERVAAILGMVESGTYLVIEKTGVVHQQVFGPSGNQPKEYPGC